MLADLVQYRDHNRLLVLFAPNATDSRLLRQRDAFGREQAEMRDRELIEIVVLSASTLPNGLDAARIRRRYHVAPQAFEALLIGKDGTVAYRTRDLVTPKALFARIDAMPMRREEIMRRKGG